MSVLLAKIKLFLQFLVQFVVVEVELRMKNVLLDLSYSWGQLVLVRQNLPNLWLLQCLAQKTI